MYCQWCGKELDDLAIHHCGPADRPPAYCRQDGQALAPGATACAICGLAAGAKPDPVAVGAVASSAAAATASAAEAAPAAAQTGGPGPGQVPPSPAAAPRPVAPVVPPPAAEEHGGAFRTPLVAASIAGLSSFFIPWFFFGFRGLLLPLGGANLSVSGITAAEYSAWSWWTPPCPQLLLVLFGAATMLSLIGWVSKSTAIDAVVAIIGAALSVLLLRWLWLTRHDFNLLTGFWLTVAAGLLVFMFAVASVVTDRAQ